MNRPTLRQLEYAVAVEEHRSFQNAADACGVSQPGLSAQLRALEDQLGARLFERSPREVVPTAAGEEVVHRARAVLAATDDLVAAARALSEPLAGPLHLGVIPTIAPFLLPSALPRIRRVFPRLRLFLHEERTPVLVERVRSGRLDVALLALEADLGDLETLALFRDPFVVAVGRDHPLARRRSIGERELEGSEVLLLEDGHCFRDQALEICHRAGASEVGDFRAASLGTLVEMVGGGMGATLLPGMAAAAPGLPRSLVVRPFRKPGPGRTVGLAWRRTSPRGEEFRRLGEVIAAARRGAWPQPARRTLPDG